MEIREAVAKAKTYIADTYQGEGVGNIGLEEIEFNDVGEIWEITIGFTRPWDYGADLIARMSRNTSPVARTYKIVRIDNSDGHLISIKNREPVA